MTNLGTYVTDPALILVMTSAAKRGATPDEIRSQRISYIVSAMSDEKTKLTSDMVERELNRLAGAAD
jgi:hypothetical protein